MIRIFVISAWELLRHLRSRSFLLATFVSPLVFAAIVLIPSFYYEKSQLEQDQVIGCVEFDTTNYCQLLSERLTSNIDEKRTFPNVLIEPIFPDTTSKMREDFSELDSAKHALDSLNEAYNKIKERRKYHFQRPDSRTKERLLSESYDEMIATRERKDLAEIEYTQLRSKKDSLVEGAVLNKADSLLKMKRISGYVLINSKTFKKGIVEFHSEQPINFLRLQPLKQALQVMLVEERMREAGITVSKIQELLDPIQIQEILLEGSSKHEFKFMITYLVPIVVVLFLFVGIFTSSGFLYSSIVAEKAGHILETLLSSVNSIQLISGKIFGMGLLGLVQVVTWLFITLVLIVARVIPAQEIAFLTMKNAGLFILYFFLGYLFFASIFVGLSALSTTGQETHHLNQFMRILSIFPIALVILVLLSPNSMLVRFLSFIPFLTPTFMILRTPLGQPPAIDYYISIGIMVVFIILAAFFAAKVFRSASLTYRPQPPLKTIVDIFRLK